MRNMEGVRPGECAETHELGRSVRWIARYLCFLSFFRSHGLFRGTEPRISGLLSTSTRSSSKSARFILTATIRRRRGRSMARLLAAGFDSEGCAGVRARPAQGQFGGALPWHGELKPLLLLAHIDVVEARKEDWSDGLDPFKLTERDGYYYGRGVIDDKSRWRRTSSPT